MAVRGKSINLFLMDGTAVGRIKCTLANWIGVAYKIPRTELDKCKERDDLALLPVKYTVQIEKLFMRLEHGIFPRSSRFLMHKLVLY